MKNPPDNSQVEKTDCTGHPVIGNTALHRSIKSDLFSILLPELKKLSPYFNIDTVCSMLKEKGIEIKCGTLRRYMSDAMAEGVVYDAGRGWYSRIKTKFEFDRKPVSKIVKLLEKEFPLLEFTCWSTQQINPWMHHLLAKFITFVNVEKDGMSAVADVLRGAGYMVHLNPGVNRADEVLPNGKTVVVRPLVTIAPREAHNSPPEGVLVDLFMENKVLNIMGKGEYRDMAINLASTSRISWGSLLYYAGKREISQADMFGENNALLQELP